MTVSATNREAPAGSTAAVGAHPAAPSEAPDVEILDVDEKAHWARLRTLLRLDASGAGRPEDVVAALDLPLRVRKAVRTRLLFVDTPPIAR